MHPSLRVLFSPSTSGPSPHVTADQTHDGERCNFSRNWLTGANEGLECLGYAALNASLDKFLFFRTRQTRYEGIPDGPATAVGRGPSIQMRPRTFSNTQQPMAEMRIQRQQQLPGNHVKFGTSSEGVGVALSRYLPMAGFPRASGQRSKTCDSIHDTAPRLSVRGLMDRSFAFKSDTGRVS